MAEENDTKTPDPLLDAVAELVFEASAPPDAKALDRARAVLDLTDRIYASTVGRIRNRLEIGQESRGAAALGVVHYALTLKLGEAVGIDDPEVRRDLLEALRTRGWITRALKLAAVRALAGHPLGDADEKAAERLTAFAAKVREDPDIHGGAGAGGGATEGGGSGPGPVDPEVEPDTSPDEILGVFAFDEARLPARLHYAVQADGRQVPSAGQKAFLAATAQAIAKVAPGERRIVEAVSATAAILLLDGHYDPDDRAFYDHVRTA